MAGRLRRGVDAAVAGEWRVGSGEWGVESGEWGVGSESRNAGCGARVALRPAPFFASVFHSSLPTPPLSTVTSGTAVARVSEQVAADYISTGYVDSVCIARWIASALGDDGVARVRPSRWVASSCSMQARGSYVGKGSRSARAAVVDWSVEVVFNVLDRSVTAS